MNDWWETKAQEIWQNVLKNLEERGHAIKVRSLTDIPWNTYTYLNLNLRRN